MESCNIMLQNRGRGGYISVGFLTQDPVAQPGEALVTGKECAPLKMFISRDSRLSQLHFLIRTKAQRGDTPAFIYNAERFFDIHEENIFSNILTVRRDHLEHALSKGLIRLGALIVFGGFVALAEYPLNLFAFPLVMLLLWDEFRIVRRASLLDRSLRDYLETLEITRGERKMAFIREMSEKSAMVAMCDRC